MTEDDLEKRREESAEWHRARAKSLRKNGFTKMAEEHEQIAQAIEYRRQQEPDEIATAWFAAQRKAPPGRG
jgi:hypothetical protein